MRRTTEKKNTVLCAAAAALLFAMLLFAMILDALGLRGGEWIALALGAACVLAVIIGVIAAAAQRFRELESGEAKEAEKY